MYFPSNRMCKKAIEQLMLSFIFFFVVHLSVSWLPGQPGQPSRPSRVGPGGRGGRAGPARRAGPAGDYT